MRKEIYEKIYRKYTNKYTSKIYGLIGKIVNKKFNILKMAYVENGIKGSLNDTVSSSKGRKVCTLSQLGKYKHEAQGHTFLINV